MVWQKRQVANEGIQLVTKCDKLKLFSAKGVEIDPFTQGQNDFVSLTDIAKYKDKERGDYVIQNWMRNRSTIDFLRIWEQINNSVCKRSRD